jgi:hypothetical protein
VLKMPTRKQSPAETNNNNLGLYAAAVAAGAAGTALYYNIQGDAAWDNKLDELIKIYADAPLEKRSAMRLTLVNLSKALEPYHTAAHKKMRDKLKADNWWETPKWTQWEKVPGVSAGEAGGQEIQSE